MSQNADTTVSSQGFEYGVKHFINPKSGFITEIMFDILGLNRHESELLLKLGAVYINNQRQNEDSNVKENTLFRIHTKPRRYTCDHDWRSRIVYENADFIVLNKPSGIPSHPSVDNKLENSLSLLSADLNTQLFITHRLDTLTEGLIVYAKNNTFVKSFNIQLQQRNIEKKYVALVEHKKQLPAKLLHYMLPSPRAPKQLSDSYVDNAALCELEILEQKNLTSELMWIKINLLTGRTHQIRAQLSHMHAPLLGDTLYGAQNLYIPHAIALRACELQFNWGTQRLQFNLNEDFDIPNNSF